MVYRICILDTELLMFLPSVRNRQSQLDQPLMFDLCRCVATNMITFKSDVYSLGVVLFEVITGVTPRSKNSEGGLASWVSSAFSRRIIACTLEFIAVFRLHKIAL